MNNSTYFNYIKVTTPVKLRTTDKIANRDEIARLNTYSTSLTSAIKFYEENLADSKIDYVYKEGKDIKALPVKYKKENFPHLTGINFAFTSANKKFDFLKNGNNSTPIIIEKEEYTFNKLKVLPKITELLNTQNTTLTELKEVEQAHQIGFSKAIKTEGNDLLLALQNFQPEFYTPKSLLNIENSEEYKNIPENTLLGVFKEKDIENGVKIEPISLNKDSLDNLAITTEMLIGMKKYANELGKSRQKEKASEEAKKREQYRRYLAQRGLNR